MYIGNHQIIDFYIEEKYIFMNYRTKINYFWRFNYLYQLFSTHYIKYIVCFSRYIIINVCLLGMYEIVRLLRNSICIYTI